MKQTSKTRRRSGTIRARVLTIALIPSLTLLVIGAVTSGYLIRQGQRVQHFADSTRDITGPTSTLLGFLQGERRATIQYLTASPSRQQAARAQLDQQRAEVDATLVQMTGSGNALLASATPEVRAAMNGFSQLVAAMRPLRQGVDAGQVSVAQAYTFYNRVLDSSAGSLRNIARAAPDPQVAYEQATALGLFQAADAMSRGDALGVAVAAGPGLSAAQYQEYINQIAFYHTQLRAMLPQMTAQERQSLAATMGSQPWRNLTSVENVLGLRAAVRGTTPALNGSPANLPVSDAQWQAASQQVAHGLVGLFLAHATFATQLGHEIGHRTLVRSIIGGLAVLLVALIAFLIALRLSNRLIRRLGRLRSDVLSLADHRLPDVVGRLRAGEQLDLAQELPPLEHGTDEIGQLAEAFNQAQRVAVEATLAEAQTKEGTKAAFLSIAHRSQVIVHRQLEVLDQAERSLDDPDQLQFLFELDHLATQARRNAENLIILGGQQPGRQWRRPVSLLEVVRSGIAETEQFMRITITPMPDVLVDGSAVADLVHLLSELVDNATVFSPPESRVEVRGGLVGRGVAIEIEDRGIGMEPGQLHVLNETLTNPPDFDVLALTTESRLGVFVVARLAARHGIKVTLTDSPYGGTRAVVLIPLSVMATTAAIEAVPDGAARSPLTPGVTRSEAREKPVPSARSASPTIGRAGPPPPPQPTPEPPLSTILPVAPPPAPPPEAFRPAARPAVPPTPATPARPAAAPSGPAATPTTPPALPPKAPTAPVARAAPAAPATPATPVRRTPPAVPAAPTAPAVRTTPPSAPVAPIARTTPPEPPTAPTQPAAPTTPATPAAPARRTPPAAPAASTPSAPAVTSPPPVAPLSSPAPPGGLSNAPGGRPPADGGRHSETAAAPAGDGSSPAPSGRPPLPVRTRQANLAPQLRESAVPTAHDLTFDDSAWPSPERARDRLAAFQRGTHRARAGDPPDER